MATVAETVTDMSNITPGVSVAYCVVGGLLLFSGIKGATIVDTTKAVLKGNLTVSNDEPIQAQNDSSSSSTSTSSSGSTPTVSATASQTQWNTALLKALGAPANAANLASLADW